MKNTLLFLFLFLFLSAPIAKASPPANDFLRVGLASPPSSFDPYSELLEANLQIAHLLFDPLLRWEQGVIKNRLLESLERIDETTWRGTIKKKVLFHSGNPLTAKDVAWTFLRAKKAKSYKAFFLEIDQVNIIDDYTVDFKTHEATDLLPSFLTYLFIMDSEFYKGVDSNGYDKGRVASGFKLGGGQDMSAQDPYSFASTNVSGTGPFIVSKFTMGNEIYFNSFNKYWGQIGNIKRLYLSYTSNGGARVSSLFSDHTDFVVAVPVNDFARLHGAPGVHLYVTSGSRVVMVQLNVAKNPALNNKIVRKAIVSATNNAVITRIIFNNNTKPAYQFPAEGDAGYVKDLLPRYNLEEAKKLIKEAGYGPEKPLKLTMITTKDRYVSDEKIALIFAGMMQKINVQVDVKVLAIEKFLPEYKQRQADLAMIGWHPDTSDTANYFEYLLMCPNAESGRGEFNFGSYCNQGIDNAVEASLRAKKYENRDAALRKAVRLAYDDVAFIPLHYESHSWATNLRIKNIQSVVGSGNLFYFADVVIEKLLK